MRAISEREARPRWLIGSLEPVNDCTRWLALLGCLTVLGCATVGEGQSGSSVSADDLRRHVETLASETMQGRRAGTPGERLATDYVAQAFAVLGLEPAGEHGSYFQSFEFASGVSLDAGNRLRVNGPESFRDYAVDRDWRPLAFSRTGRSGAAPVVFAGYGIVAPATDGLGAHDAYTGLDVEGHWVLVLRFVPKHVDAETRQHLNRYASLRYKAKVARDRGAVGLILVSGPEAKVKDALVPLRLDASVGAISLLSISITDAVAAELLAPSGRILAALQSGLDSGEPQPGFTVPNLTLDVDVDLVQEKREARNVLARLRAPGGENAPPLVIGAHVDHLGRGRGGASLARGGEKGQVHPGADDNASGVAAVLEIAESLATSVREGRIVLARDVIFAVWSGEEVGLLGSAAFTRGFAEQSHGTARAAAAYINLDMIGRLRDRMVLYGVGSSSTWRSVIERSNAPIGLPIVLREDSYLPTDATSFHVKGIPTLTMFTGVHSEYHTPRDRPGTLNYAGLVRITRFVEAVARVVAASPAVPDFVVADAPQRLGERAGLRAALGTIPSYTEGEVLGLPISGVTRGGPAEGAGLRGGRPCRGAGGRQDREHLRLHLRHRRPRRGRTCRDRRRARR
ncbi:MAG: M28 family peptidase [Myxococcota bacterium]